MKVISKSRKAVRAALASEGWRFSLVLNLRELKEHHHTCRGLILPSGSESDNRVRSIRERLLRQLSWAGAAGVSAADAAAVSDACAAATQ